MWKWTGADIIAFLEVNKYLQKKYTYEISLNFAALVDNDILSSIAIKFNLINDEHSIESNRYNLLL